MVLFGFIYNLERLDTVSDFVKLKPEQASTTWLEGSLALRKNKGKTDDLREFWFFLGSYIFFLVCFLPL